MRTVTTQTTDAWKAAFKGGSDRPMMRATIQKIVVRAIKYDLEDVPAVSLDGVVLGKSETMKEFGGVGWMRSASFGQQHVPVELPNLASVSYQRSIDQTVASCTLELYNTEILPIGQSPENSSDHFERPGYFTPNRGVSAESQSRWGQATNGWRDLLIPDRVIRLYEGYGYDPNLPPETDPHMYPSGVWRIDQVTYTADGKITVECRDLGSQLLDLIMYPPIIPWPQYPAFWEAFKKVDNPDVIDESKMTGGSWFRPKYQTDSNIPYIGKGFSDGSRPYVESDGEVLGHGGPDAFDGSNDSYWLSVGNLSGWSSAFEYVQGRFSARKVAAVKVRSWGGPYKVYISVKKSDGTWYGRHDIPYDARAVDTDADIDFVMSAKIGKNDVRTFKLPKVYKDAVAVRVTFTDLYDSGIGYYRYRAGCRDVQVYKTDSDVIETRVDGGYHVEGNYSDYTDIVKWFLSWAGFHWPGETTGDAYQYYSDGTKVIMNPPSRDPIFVKGRTWGDFELTRTQGIQRLNEDIFDKKPVMDGITYIRDIVGFVFFIDETGGAVFRSPNIWQPGNYLSGLDGGPNVGRTSSVITIDENETLLAMSTSLSNRNVRERIFVANTTGKIGAVAKGYNPAWSNIMRVAGWTDQHFSSIEECRRMADLINIRGMFTYRTNNIEIPGNPAIQIDDQVQIYERVTSETNRHYVRGLSCEWDLESGRYVYNLETNWLGDRPFQWISEYLDAVTIRYLKLMGKI